MQELCQIQDSGTIIRCKNIILLNKLADLLNIELLKL